MVVLRIKKNETCSNRPTFNPFLTLSLKQLPIVPNFMFARPEVLEELTRTTKQGIPQTELCFIV